MLAAKLQIVARKCTSVVFQTLEASLFLVWLVLANSARADASSTPATKLPEVTVTAPRPPTPQELAGDAVHNFVRVHAAPALVTGQLARWNVEVCPKTEGLSPAVSDFISARILAIAASVGAPYRKRDRCAAGRHNIYVFFTTEPKKALTELVKQDPRVLGYRRSRMKELEKITPPIQGWYVNTSRGAWGDETIDEVNPLLPLEFDILRKGKHPAGLPGSRFGSSISSNIVNVVIIADANKLVGHAIGPMADYIAMLALTQDFGSEQCGTLPSIMDYMARKCGDREQPTGITAGDLAFLRGLYRADMEVFLPMERSSIINHMVREFNGQSRVAN